MPTVWSSDETPREERHEPRDLAAAPASRIVEEGVAPLDQLTAGFVEDDDKVETV